MYATKLIAPQPLHSRHRVASLGRRLAQSESQRHDARARALLHEGHRDAYLALLHRVRLDARAADTVRPRDAARHGLSCRIEKGHQRAMISSLLASFCHLPGTRYKEEKVQGSRGCVIRPG